MKMYRLGLFSSQKGMTILEVLIATGLVSIVFMGVQSAVTQYLNQSQSSKTSVANDRIVDSLIRRIMSDINQFQVNYGELDIHPGTGKCESDKAVLPVAWDIQTFTSVEKCPKCPGRLGYWVQPLPNFRGLFRVTIRMSNDNLFGPGVCQDYQLIVGNR